MNKYSKWILVITATTLVLLVIWYGVSGEKTESLDKPQVSLTDEEMKEYLISQGFRDVEIKDGKFTAKGDGVSGGEMAVSNYRLPVNWPVDLPFYPNSSLAFVMEDLSLISASFDSSDSPMDVGLYFEKVLSSEGWRLVEFDMEEKDFIVVKAEKDTRTVDIMTYVLKSETLIFIELKHSN